MGNTGKRLLLIDRDSRSRRVFAEAIAGLGATLTVVEDAALVIRSIREERFDAVFVDALFPGLDAHAFLRLLASAANCETPAFWLVAAGSAPAAAERMRQVAKPSNPAEIKPLLEGLLGERPPTVREEPRLAIRTTIACAQGTRCFRGMSINLCFTGMLAEFTLPLELSQEFDVHFPLPGQPEALRAHVQVTRIESPGIVGLTFENMARADRQRLETFLAKHLKPATQPPTADALAMQRFRPTGR